MGGRKKILNMCIGCVRGYEREAKRREEKKRWVKGWERETRKCINGGKRMGEGDKEINCKCNLLVFCRYMYADVDVEKGRNI